MNFSTHFLLPLLGIKTPSLMDFIQDCYMYNDKYPQLNDHNIFIKFKPQDINITKTMLELKQLPSYITILRQDDGDVMVFRCDDIDTYDKFLNGEYTKIDPKVKYMYCLIYPNNHYVLASISPNLELIMSRVEKYVIVLNPNTDQETIRKYNKHKQELTNAMKEVLNKPDIHSETLIMN